MTDVSDTSSHSAGTLRVLVVDNDPTIRELHRQLLLVWGHCAVVAEGVGRALLADAKTKARERRCQIALVDMRLLDDYDTRDQSGLKLVPELRPTVSIIVSAKGDRKTATAAFTQYKAFDFVGKEDGPERLRATIEEAAKSLSIGRYRAEITWSHGLSSPAIRDLLFPNQLDVPDDEIGELIGRMFPDAKHIGLMLITDTSHASDGESGLRRRSRVFRVIIDNNPAFLVLKLARTNKIERELANYDLHVKRGLPGQFRPYQDAHALLWDVGGVAYNYIGNADIATSDGPKTFTTFYRETEDLVRILKPIRHFFDDTNWGFWYKNDITARDAKKSLFDVYDATWNGALNQALEQWRTHDRLRFFPGLSVALINPTSWLSEHYSDSKHVQSRQAKTHGDLHGDNLFVDSDHAWPIDFERTGFGPILRDFVELIHDILTRLAHIEPDDLRVLYDLAVALCEPRTPGIAMQPTRAIQGHTAANKAFDVVQALLKLAHERAQHGNQRELLWGLLLNSLFVATLLPEEDVRWVRTLLLASVICGRLDRWDNHMWPCRGWPPVTWGQGSDRPDAGGSSFGGDSAKERLESATIPGADEVPAPTGTSVFSHGYALLIGVGHDLPVTARDAAALHTILTDPQRCAYPASQVCLLVEGQATRQQILRQLDRLIDESQDCAEATVIVYFSGHGGLMPTYHLVPYGYNPDDLSNTAISGAEFTEKLRAIRARKLLVLLDCCHAGGMAEAKTADMIRSPLPPELDAMLSAGSGRVVIASSRKDELSYTGTPYSVFTQTLCEGLAGYGTAELDGYAYVADVALYAGRRVPERTSDRQHPILKLSEADNFALAYYAGGAKEPRPLPEAQSYLPPITVLGLDMVEGYRQVLKEYQRRLLAAESQKARFFDQASVPLDLERTRQGLLQSIAEVEATIEQHVRAAGWRRATGER